MNPPFWADLWQFLHEKFRRPDRERVPRTEKIGRALFYLFLVWIGLGFIVILILGAGINPWLFLLAIPWGIIARWWSQFGSWYDAKYNQEED